MKNIRSIILAAGKGTRMKSKNSKVVHKIAGKALITWVLEAAEQAGIKDNILVTGHREDQVKELLGDRAAYVTQHEKLGTGHAVMMAEEYIAGFNGYIAVLAGDVPLISSETIKKSLERIETEDISCVVITADVPDSTGYGRIIRNSDGNVDKIVEHLDATDKERRISEINSGMYVFRSEKLAMSLKKLNNDNKKGEYYLTDTIEILRESGEKIAAIKANDYKEILGINSKKQLYEASESVKKRINDRHMENGVIIIDPNNTYIESEAVIGMDTTIYPNTFIEGNTKIGEDCEIGPGSRLVSSEIGDDTKVLNSIILESKVGSHTKIGPFSYIRPESVLGDKIKIGDFVEIKKSVIKDKTSISHLTYVGDAEVGRNVNIGCGVVCVNYDGQVKHKTIIGDHAFIGCNTNLVAPVTIEDNGYTAAGSTITKNVPEYALGISRSKQTNLEDWVKRTKRERKEKK
jgi:bifunctional UDP-N-acetylglucosamine pyrophosphorylase/glucosamine-1-phosphate N-acetyltransferase